MTKKSTQPNRVKRARRVVIPAGVKSLDAVYDILARDLALPRHFGRNLDALYDALTGDVEGPIAIAVEDAAAVKRRLGAKGRALLQLLREASRARKDLTIFGA
jgi:ribonuclease inhibitor